MSEPPEIEHLPDDKVAIAYRLHRSDLEEYKAKHPEDTETMVQRVTGFLQHYEQNDTGPKRQHYIEFYREMLKYAITLDRIERDLGEGLER